ncbi:hypothetical protein [Cellulosilyticum sp. WCF-2]|uniref:hypothetical protein n=1 Tax=Cellulosilyticum sp. WCF-2 TaxID=2497860 RepID=UPI000F8EF7F0|nr:hypothetical protein [Cellulosilyticum sp. WCF-2]QEH69738.1 hypothetical protein EKH84_15585 [Cellulosilyticum sp. WCF-2]
MTEQDKCILDMYKLIDEFTTKAEKRDMSLLRIPSISGCDAYQGMPPISRLRDELFDKYAEVISKAYDASIQ